MGRSSPRFAALFSLLLASALPASAQSVPREALVQLEESHSDALAQLLSEDPQLAREWIGAIAGASGSVLSIVPVFTIPREPGLTRSQSFDAHVERVRRRFPRRKSPQPEKPAPRLDRFFKVALAEGADLEACLRNLSRDPGVLSAEKNGLLFPSTDPLPSVPYIPNEAYISSDGINWSEGSLGQLAYPDLWGHRKVKILEAFNLFPDPQGGPGAGVLVAVTDTGIDYNHPDLAPNIWTNADETLNGRDDDGNGFIDDIRGWDFIGPTCNYDPDTLTCISPQPDNDPRDLVGHGTHVSGTIAAVGNNAQGIVGMAPNARLMAVKGFPDDGGGSAFDLLADALVYAASNGARVINASWGCGPCTSPACLDIPVLVAAVDFAHDTMGATLVFAAGNSSCDVANLSPQNMPKVITVGASSRYDERSSFSNFGSLLDVAAPGGGPATVPPSSCPEYNILSLRSLAPGALNYENRCSGNLDVGGQALRLAGTSMSAPHVSGLAALLLSVNPGLGNVEVQETIKASAEDVAPPGFDIYTGFGRIDAFEAILLARCPQANPSSSVHLVPCEFPTIQAAIDAAGEGDVVELADGTYTGPGNRGLRVAKTITIRSSGGPSACAIDCQDQDQGILFSDADGSWVYPVLEGIAIRNGLANSGFVGSAKDSGGGAHIRGRVNPTIRNCVIEDCESLLSGGGIYANSPMNVENCVIRRNRSTLRSGGGIAIYSLQSGSTQIANSLIAENSAQHEGGGIYISNHGDSLSLDILIRNCTIAFNQASLAPAGSYGGGGMYTAFPENDIFFGNTLEVNGCIFWGNQAVGETTGHQIHRVSAFPSPLTIFYSDVQDGAAGIGGQGCDWRCWGTGDIQGNIVDAPLFLSAPTDLHIERASPCRDAGDPSYLAAPGEKDIDGEPRVSRGRVDMGSDEVKFPPFFGQVGKPRFLAGFGSKKREELG